MSSDESLKTSRVVPEVRKEVIPGTVLQQRYRLQRLLDSGGMGQAWLATDATRIVGGSAAQVVIKLLPFALRWNESAAQDFAREYGRVWLLSHPHICKLFDMGQDPQVGSFQVMQFLSGVTIRQLQQQHPGGVDRSVALRIVAACADGLDYAHQQKVIHRDVKPENVMYDPATGTVHLIDFGLAAEIRESLSRYSQGFVAQAGTERYMSPEQWLGQLQNAGCDQWALGVMAWELLTGAAPYHGSGMTLGFAVCQAPVPKLPSHLSVLQPVFDRVLQKQASDRYGTCREFVEELTGLLQPRAVPVSQPVSQRVQPVTRPGLLSAPFSGSAAASAQAAWGNFLGRSVQWPRWLGVEIDFDRLSEPGGSLMEQLNVPDEALPEALEKAKRRLDSMAVVGTVENIGGFVERVFDLIGLPAPVQIPHQNTGHGVQAGHSHRESTWLPAAVVRRVERVTAYDQELYVYACRLAGQRRGSKPYGATRSST